MADHTLLPTAEPRERRTVTLPNDIWLIILKDFIPELPLHNGRFRWPYQRDEVSSDLLSIRATCRSLRQLIDPLLFPVMYVDLNRHSMQRLEQLSRNSDIARGVRAVEVNLSIWPASYASSLTAFSGIFLDIVRRIQRACDWETEFEHYEPGDTSEDARKYRALLFVQHRCRSILCDIGACVAQAKDTEVSHTSISTSTNCVSGSSAEEHDSQYRRLLKESFAIYKDQQIDQQQVITDQAFVKTLAGSISRFPSSVKLAFVDSALDVDVGSEDALTILDDLVALQRRILRSRAWLDVEHRDTVPAHIIFELLVACDQAGTPLQNLDVGCFPLVRNFGALVAAADGTPYRWSDLTRACRTLRCFTVGDRGMNCTPSREQRMRGAEAKIIQRYIGAICSSPLLESVELKMVPFRKTYNDYLGEQSADEYIQLGCMADRWRSPVLSRLTLFDLAMASTGLENVINKLAPSLQHLSLVCIYLEEGGYAKAMDMLRQKMYDSATGNKGTIHLSTLQGGEFGPSRQSPGSSRFLGGILETGWMERYEDFSKPPLLRKVLEYLSSEEDLRNPLEGMAVGGQIEA